MNSRIAAAICTEYWEQSITTSFERGVNVLNGSARIFSAFIRPISIFRVPFLSYFTKNFAPSRLCGEKHITARALRRKELIKPVYTNFFRVHQPNPLYPCSINLFTFHKHTEALFQKNKFQTFTFYIRVPFIL